jgi:hypothetical protein
MSCVQLSDAQKKKNIYKNTASGRSNAMEFSHIMRNTKFDLTRKNVNCIPKIEYLFAIGGYNSINTTELLSVEKFDGITWSNSIPMTIARMEHGVVVYNNLLYVIGGSNNLTTLKSVTVFDGNTWKPAIDMLVNRNRHACIEFKNCIYAIGGESSFAGPSLNSAEKFDGGNWTNVTNNMNTPRKLHKCVVYNNELFVVGGFNGGTALSSVEKFDGTNWTTVSSSMNTPRYNHGLVVYNNLIYAIGGQSLSGTYLNTVETYDGSTWVLSTQLLNTPRTVMCATIFNGFIYIYGGILTAGILSTNKVERFDGISWTYDKEMIEFRYGAEGTVYKI